MHCGEKYSPLFIINVFARVETSSPVTTTKSDQVLLFTYEVNFINGLWSLPGRSFTFTSLKQDLNGLRLDSNVITILKYHSLYLCKISLQIMLLYPRLSLN